MAALLSLSLSLSLSLYIYIYIYIFIYMIICHSLSWTTSIHASKSFRVCMHVLSEWERERERASWKLLCLSVIRCAISYGSIVCNIKNWIWQHSNSQCSKKKDGENISNSLQIYIYTEIISKKKKRQTNQETVCFSDIGILESK